MNTKRSDYVHVGGDIDKVLINGEIMPLRSGNTSSGVSRKNILRGEDIVFLMEGAKERYFCARYDKIGTEWGSKIDFGHKICNENILAINTIESEHYPYAMIPGYPIESDLGPTLQYGDLKSLFPQWFYQNVDSSSPSEITDDDNVIRRSYIDNLFSETSRYNVFSYSNILAPHFMAWDFDPGYSLPREALFFREYGNVYYDRDIGPVTVEDSVCNATNSESSTRSFKSSKKVTMWALIELRVIRTRGTTPYSKETKWVLVNSGTFMPNSNGDVVYSLNSLIGTGESLIYRYLGYTPSRPVAEYGGQITEEAHVLVHWLCPVVEVRDNTRWTTP